jgi:uncharacterized protein (TIGR00369 family)
MTDTPNAASLKLNAEQLNDFLWRAFPGKGDREQRSRIVEVSPGFLRTKLPYNPAFLRPGGVISGPTMMSMADTSAYALILAHIGEVEMAVTTSLTIHFLRPCKQGDLVADATLLRLGRRIATCDIRLWTEAPDKIAAQATVAYAIPT